MAFNHDRNQRVHMIVMTGAAFLRSEVDNLMSERRLVPCIYILIKTRSK